MTIAIRPWVPLTKLYHRTLKPNLDALTVKAVTGRLTAPELTHLITYMQAYARAFDEIQRADIKTFIFGAVLDPKRGYPQSMRQLARNINLPEISPDSGDK
jgi:hypothetical protein